MTFAERTRAVAAHGFTERQARFLVTVMLHAGVCVERQYCAFAGIGHGQKTHDFFDGLERHRFARVHATGLRHRGRIFHVQYKPLYRAIGEVDNRHRKPMSMGRAIERLMVLDAVLSQPGLTWLGSEHDKVMYFSDNPRLRLCRHDLPQVTFSAAGSVTTRHFPDKLPIGVDDIELHHVLLYLVTKPAPADFRAFLIRHMELLRVVPRWSVRLLFPRQFWRARGTYEAAFREQVAMPLRLSERDELEWLFREWKRLGTSMDSCVDPRLLAAHERFSAPRFRALYRRWLRDGPNLLYATVSPLLADALERGEGRLELVQIAHPYMHLDRLVGTS